MTPIKVALSVLAGLLVLGDAFLVTVAQAVRMRRTERRWLRAGPVRRLYRAWRSTTFRFWLWWLAWPHLVDVVLRSHRTDVMATPSVLVWRRGRATLSRLGVYDARRAAREPVILVHSVVTRPWILDLLPHRSVAGALVEAGHDVYLLDWGDPGRGDATQGFTAHTKVLAQAAGAVAHRSPTGRVHVVGYCMGATLALSAVGAWGPGPIASLALIAPPFDTQVPGGMAAVLNRSELMPVLALDGDGCVPGAFVREGFHLLRRKALKAALARLRMRKDKEFQRVAAALSRWAWEQRRVPGALWFDLVDMFRTNALLRGTLHVGGDRVDLSRVTVPTMILVTDRDHIVPIASSLALTRHLPQAKVVRSPAGHVSMLMGHESRTVAIPALDAWLRDPDSVPAGDSG